MSNILNQIHCLEDYKKLSKEDLPILAQEIRSFLIDSISQTGGHLASNLGIVELTMALHYVFHSPDDKLVFDVGHQCYVHKILTGRKDKFTTLRKLGGISGFPKARESIHDVFDTGHSSTSISSAIGIATANRLAGNDHYAISIIGDGAMTGGLAFEGLNNAKDANLIVVLNDNQMSISPSVGNLSLYLNKLRSNRFYTTSKRDIRKLLSHIPLVGNYLIRFFEIIKNAIREPLLPKAVMFEQFGFTYLGPIDGHDLNGLIEILERAKTLHKPVIIHAITKKGKGYSFAEENPNRYHSIGKFNKETGEPLSAKRDSYSKTFGQTLCNLAKENDKIVAITAAMPDGTGLTSFMKEFPHRLFDVGIAEEHAVSFASGLAKQGYVPFFAVYSTFLQRAYDQIIHDVALQNLHVVFMIDRAGIVGSDGETHHGLFDLAYLSSIPNMTIMAPKDANEFVKMIKLSVSLEGPVAIRYPRDGYVETISSKKIDKAAFKHSSIIIKGFQCRKNQKLFYKPLFLKKAEIVQPGKDLTIIGYGKTVLTALKIAEIKKNQSIEIINLRFLKPLDQQTIIHSLQKTKRVVVIEDHTKNGGVGSAIKDLLCTLPFKVKAQFFSYPDEFIKHGETSELEELYHLSAKKIAKKI